MRPSALFLRRVFLALLVPLLFISMTFTSPFSAIVAGSPAEYDTYQVKFTYTGIQSKTTPTLMLVGSGLGSPSPGDFIAHRTPGIHYGNDDVKIIDLVVPGSVIGQFIDGLQQKPYLQVSGGATEPLMSLMIARNAGTVFEHLATDIEADEIVTFLEGATQGESPTTRDLVRRFRNFTVGPH